MYFVLTNGVVITPITIDGIVTLMVNVNQHGQNFSFKHLFLRYYFCLYLE